MSHYKNGIRHGWYFEYFPDGKLKKRVQYKEGLPIGRSTAFHENGRYRCSGEYDAQGEANGRFNAVYDNGVVNMTGQEKAGKIAGNWYCYRRDGSLEKILPYNDAEKVTGVVQYYDRSGKLEKVEVRRDDVTDKAATKVANRAQRNVLWREMVHDVVNGLLCTASVRPVEQLYKAQLEAISEKLQIEALPLPRFYQNLPA